MTNPFIEFTKWLLKWTGILVGGLLGLVALLTGGAWSWHWWKHDRHVPNLRVVVINGNSAGVPSKVVAGDRPVETLCKGEFPIFVGYTNGSTRTVEHISIRLVAHLPQHSTNILEWEAQATMDRIVPPHEGFGSCWKFALKDAFKDNPKTADAIYEGEVWSVTFEE